MRSCATLSIRGDGQLGRTVSAPPITFRRTADAVHLVNTAAGPIGDDVIDLTVDVAAGAVLRLRSAAASILYAGTGTEYRTTVTVGAGARLDWRPEPTIATSGCAHRQLTSITAHASAEIDWTEELLLGRHGEAPGRVDIRLDVDHGGRPLLRHQLVVGAPGWDGPGGLGGHRAVGLRLRAGPGRPADRVERCAPGCARLALDGPGILLVAVAGDLASLRALMAD